MVKKTGSKPRQVKVDLITPQVGGAITPVQINDGGMLQHVRATKRFKY